jgi:hypothetical protein
MSEGSRWALAKHIAKKTKIDDQSTAELFRNVPLLLHWQFGPHGDSSECDSLLEFVNGARDQVNVLRDLWQRTGESVSVDSVTGRPQGTSTAGNLVTPGTSIEEEDLFRKVAIREVRRKRDEWTQLRYTQVRTHAQRLMHESSQPGSPTSCASRRRTPLIAQIADVVPPVNIPAATGIGVPRGIGNLSTGRLNTRQMASSVVIPLDGTSDVVSATNKSWIEALRDALVCGRPLPDAPDGTPATLRAAAQKLVEARQQSQPVQRMLSNSQSKQ